MKQRYTQYAGRRPYGISCLLTGFDDDGTPHLYQTDPAGVYTEWKANAIGRNAKTVREFLEKAFPNQLEITGEAVPGMSGCFEVVLVESGKVLTNPDVRSGRFFYEYYLLFPRNFKFVCQIFNW